MTMSIGAVDYDGLIPGAVASWFLMHSLAWIVFMSWFSAVYAAVSAWAAETPVEEENGED